jgi:hypothetical protein
MFAYLNAHGGLAGHKIVPYYTKADGNASNYANQSQTVCTQLAEDDKVQVVLSYFFAQPAFSSCLQQHNVAQLDDEQASFSDSVISSLKAYVNPFGITVERELKLMFQRETGNGFMTSKNVLGLMTEDCEGNSYMNNTLVPALSKQYGVKVILSILPCYTGTAVLANALSQIQNAELKFRSNGVDRVFADTPSEGTAIAEFYGDARNQKYYPSYVVSTNAVPYANQKAQTQGAFEADMTKDMHGIGWGPNYDLGPRAPLTPAVKAQRAVCDRMDPSHAGASQYGALEQNVLEGFYTICDNVLILGEILAHNGGATSMNAIVSGFEQYATPFRSAANYGAAIDLSAARRDGPINEQDFSFKQDCACFTADGALHRIPV